MNQLRSERTILGIDPGYGRVGYGLITQSSRKLFCKEYGCITTPSRDGLAARLLSIHRQLSEIIVRTTPHAIAVEKIFFYNNTKTAIDVSQARGVIILTAQLHGIPLTEVTPLQAKQAVAGYGQAEKNQVQKMVTLILGLTTIPKPDDAADALAIAICAGQMPSYH